MTRSIDEQHQPRSSSGLSRRGFLTAIGGAAGLGIVAVACGSDNAGKSTGTSVAAAPTTGAPTAPSSGAATTAAPTSGSPSGDAEIAATAAGLEVLAVGTYKAALDAATAGQLGAVPPAVATFVQTAMAQHQQALDAWNAVLRTAGAQPVTQPPADLKATVDKAFASVKDATDAATLAKQLEQTAADTYLAVLPSIQSKDAITLAGALQSVDQEHTAILNFVLGMYPVPDVFQTTALAYTG